jgi:hypothetical protein
MSTVDAPVCPRHEAEVRMHLRTLHSDQSAPEQVLAVYACPQCGAERRMPIVTPRSDGGRPDTGEGSLSRGAA